VRISISFHHKSVLFQKRDTVIHLLTFPISAGRAIDGEQVWVVR
jgi:hypothetical protein